MLSHLRVSWRTPVRIGLLGSAAMTFTAHACWIKPIGIGREAQAHALESTRREVARAERAAATLPEITRVVTALGRRKAMLMAAVVSEQEAAGLLRDVQALGEGPDLRVTGFKPAAPLRRDSLTEWSVMVELEGTYAGVLRFLHDIAEYPRVVVVSGLRLRIADRARAGVSLTASCRLSTFVPTESAADVRDGTGRRDQPHPAAPTERQP
jgi:Tfp pilus assembly protein PilO